MPLPCRGRDARRADAPRRRRDAAPRCAPPTAARRRLSTIYIDPPRSDPYHPATAATSHAKPSRQRDRAPDGRGGGPRCVVVSWHRSPYSRWWSLRAEERRPRNRLEARSRQRQRPAERPPNPRPVRGARPSTRCRCTGSVTAPASGIRPSYETFSQAINFEMMFSKLLDRGWKADGTLGADPGPRRQLGHLARTA